METRQPINLQDLPDYIKLLSGHPIFSIVQQKDLVELLNQCTVSYYLKDETILKEGGLIDGIYFLIQGKCEVRKHTHTPKGSADEPIALIVQGEAIGLDDYGVYSRSGTHTASVIALSDAKLLRIDIQLFKDHPRINEILTQQVEMLIRMHLIKSVVPFSSLDNKTIKQFAERIEEISYPAGQTIFKMGDPSDACYIIKAGMVEISMLSQNGSSKVLADLKPNDVFGESGVMLDLPRNATARCTAPTTLLCIEKFLLKEIKQQTAGTSESLNKLQLNRSRPTRLSNITLHTETKADGSIFTVLKNEDTGKYFELSQHDHFIWNLLDGESSLDNIAKKFFAKYQVYNPDEISAFIINLHQAGFIELDVNDEMINTEKHTSFWSRIRLKIQSLIK